MKSLRSLALLFAAGLLAVSLSACDSTGDDEDLEPNYETVLVEDIAADPPINTGGGRPRGTGRYTFFSLRDGEVVLSSSNADSRADSASAQWDIAFQATNVYVNSGTSGPGEGAAYVAEGAFQEIDEVDVSQFGTDDADAGQYAIQPGSGNGWYSYAEGVITPIPGRTIVLRTADGEQYAKVNIISYYEGYPDEPTANSRYYTFEYVLSDDTTFD